MQKKTKKNTGLELLQLDYTTRKFFCSSMIVSFRTFKHQPYVLWLDTFFESNVKTCQNLSKNGFCPFSLIYIYFSKEINYFKPNLRFCHLKASSSTIFGFSLKKNSTFKYLEFFFTIYHDLLQKKVSYFFSSYHFWVEKWSIFSTYSLQIGKGWEKAKLILVEKTCISISRNFLLFEYFFQKIWYERKSMKSIDSMSWEAVGTFLLIRI